MFALRRPVAVTVGDALATAHQVLRARLTRRHGRGILHVQRHDVPVSDYVSVGVHMPIRQRISARVRQTVFRDIPTHVQCLRLRPTIVRLIRAFDLRPPFELLRFQHVIGRSYRIAVALLQMSASRRVRTVPADSHPVYLPTRVFPLREDAILSPTVRRRVVLTYAATTLRHIPAALRVIRRILGDRTRPPVHLPQTILFSGGEELSFVRHGDDIAPSPATLRQNVHVGHLEKFIVLRNGALQITQYVSAFYLFQRVPIVAIPAVYIRKRLQILNEHCGATDIRNDTRRLQPVLIATIGRAVDDAT